MWSKQIQFLVVLLISFHFILLVHTEDRLEDASDILTNQTSCWTSNNLTGTCIQREACTINQTEIDLCSPDATNNYICCPNENITNLDLSLLKQTQCGKHPDFFTIIGGHEAKPHYFPWVVAIYKTNFLNKSNFICAGTLISPQYVLSAAHCFKYSQPAKPEQFQILIGAHNLQNSGKFYKLKKIFIHENYRHDQSYNDIALVKLDEPVHRKIPFVACLLNLHTANRILREGVTLTIAGWGKTSTSYFGSISSKLLTANVKYINTSECSRNYSRLEFKDQYPHGIDNSMICAGFRQGGVDSCQGDSGGPLMYTDANNNVYLVGIVSFGYGCAYPNYPGIYTKVPKFLNWINSKLDL